MKERLKGEPPFIIYPDLSFADLRATVISQFDDGQQFGQKVLHRALRAADWYRPREERGPAAWAAMAKLEEQLENRAYAIAQDLSSSEWLWYMRRVEWLFTAIPVPPPMVPNPSYTMAIAESVSALSAAATKGSSTPIPRTTYPTGRDAAASVLRMHAVSVLLANTQATLRWAAKGAAVRAIGGLIQIQSAPELDARVNLWDQRMRDDNDDFLGRAGLYTHLLGSVPDPSLQFAEVAILVKSDHGYQFSLLRLAEIPALLDSSLPADLRWPTSLLDLIALLWAPILGWLKKGLQETADIQRCGYWVTTRDLVLGELGSAVEAIGALRLRGAIPEEVRFGRPEEIFNRLAFSEVCLWPPSMGPVIRTGEEGWVIVDFEAATQALRQALSKPHLEGEDDTAWSTHFEKSIQAALNASPWKPSTKIRDLRGRHLAAGRATITDIDAVGESGKRLLVVSCKSRPFSDAWNRGDNDAVRNVASNVDEAVAQWADRTAKLREARHGDNYDFSAYEEIIGVVVFPTVPWTPTETSVAEVLPGLRVAVSAGEFGKWVSK